LNDRAREAEGEIKKEVEKVTKSGRREEGNFLTAASAECFLPTIL
jgi:hypothetical protein